MAHTGLEDSSLDVAVFNLSLMGTNFTDYLREAHRTLKIDGELRIIEAASRFSDAKGPDPAAKFKKGLRRLGYANIDVAALGQHPGFLEITAFKKHAARPPEGIKASF
jgi:transcriptional regulator of nitric oxide reductase